LSSIIFNYISAVITDPGSPSAAHDKNDRNLISRHLQSNVDEPQCKKCQLPKPERTHHCSICKRCVHKMVMFARFFCQICWFDWNLIWII
jgi:palmitoyltransferase